MTLNPDSGAGATSATLGSDSVTGRTNPFGGTTGEWSQQPETADMGRPRVSVWAGLGLIVALIGLGGAVTGLLAPEGVALGGLGLLMSLVGIVTAGRPARAGRGLAVLGLLLGAAAVGIGVLAMTHNFSWPNSHVNEVSRLHDWLVDQWSWLDRW